MAHRIPLLGMAFWGAWVLAGILGSGLVYLVVYLGWFGPIHGVGDVWIANVVGSAIVAFPQYIVLRLLIGHSSLAGAMWIPVSAIAWLAADLAIYALLSVGSIQALMPGPFPFFDVISVIENLTPAAVLGLAQGLLLARVFVARSATWLWFVANVFAAVVVWIVIQIRNDVSNQTNQTFLDLLLPIAIFGGLYAAVTGIALVALPRRDWKGVAPAGG